MSQKASPPIPQASPKTTARTAFVAIAASTAVPPARRIPRPAAVARWWGATTAPRPPRARGAGTSGRGVSTVPIVGAARQPLPPASPAAYPARDGSLAVGRRPRDVHPPLQHGPDGRHARLLPRRPARIRRRAGRRDRAGPLHGLVLRRGAGPVARLRHARGPLRLPPDHGAGPGLRRRGGRPHRDHHEPRPPRRDALAGGRLDGGQRARDPGLRRDRHRRRTRACAAAPSRASRRRRSPGSAAASWPRASSTRRSATSPSSSTPSSTASRGASTASASATRASTAPATSTSGGRRWPATGRSCAAPTSGSWRRPGSPSTRSSGCGRPSRSSS